MLSSFLATSAIVELVPKPKARPHTAEFAEERLRELCDLRGQQNDTFTEAMVISMQGEPDDDIPLCKQLRLLSGTYWKIGNVSGSPVFRQE